MFTQRKEIFFSGSVQFLFQQNVPKDQCNFCFVTYVDIRLLCHMFLICFVYYFLSILLAVLHTKEQFETLENRIRVLIAWL